MKHCLLKRDFESRIRDHSIQLRFLFIAVLSLFCTALFAQIQVSGKVTSGDSVLTNVTVQVKGTGVATQTNSAGEYSLSAAGTGTLVFSSVGFNSMEVKINNRTSVDVVLQGNNVQLTDVVVVGYSTQRKATVTGSVSSISSKDLVTTPAGTTSGALVGKVQGITTRSPDSRPGRGVNIQIRNMGNPLFVIDGVPYTGGSTGVTGFGFNQGSGQDVFNSLGLEDIESITILKDASASIYGLRAANGVVLVTTKKGKRGEAPKINLSGYWGFQNFTRYPKPPSAYTHQLATVEAAQNSNQDPNTVLTKAELEKWRLGTDSGYQSYDYFKIVTRPNVPQKYISASATGGTNRSTYYISLSHLDQDALLKDFKYQRTNVQANLNTQLANRLQLGAQISLRREYSFNIGVPGLDDYFNPFLSVFSMWPTEAPYANNNPKYVNNTHNVNVNPATYTKEITGWIDEYWHTMDMKMNLQYDFPFGLVAKGTINYNYQNEDFDGMEYTYPAYIYNKTTGVYEDRAVGSTIPYGNQNPWREKHKRNVISRYAQFTLNYNKTFGDHSVAAVVGYERSDYENSYFVVHTIPSNNFIPLMSFSEQDILQDQWAIEARAGYIGRLNYNYKQKYLLELLGRYDGSYLYEKDNRWGFFSGASAGWRISEEPWFKKGMISDLKIRASYGETGSEQGINAFDYLPGYTYPAGNSVFDGVLTIGSDPRTIPITNLSWILNRTMNVGVDVSLLNGKLTGQFDLFERRRTGVPAPKYDVLLPSEVGYILPNENLNKDATRGVEGIVNYNTRFGDVDFTAGVNASYARNWSIYDYKQRFGNSYNEYRTSMQGRYIGVTGHGNSAGERANNNAFGYTVIGQFQSQEQIDKYPVNIDGQGNRTMLPGDFIYKDYNGDNIINDLDRTAIGYQRGANPFISYGATLNAGYKGITLTVVLAGAAMQSFENAVESKILFQNNGTSPHYFFEDRWHRADPYDPNSAWIPGKYPAIRRGNTHINYQLSDFWLTNITYLRVRNIELGYNLPKNIISRFGISSFRVYTNATNLFTFDNMKKWELDPEITSGGGLVYPQQKLITFGFNVSF